MDTFQIKGKPYGVDDMTEDYYKHGFVCMGWAETGDLRGVDKEGTRKKLQVIAKRDGWSVATLRNQLGSLNCFVNTMVDGSAVLLKSKRGTVYVGIAGEYDYDTIPTGKDVYHMRRVSWQREVPIHEFNSEVRKFVNNRGAITRFPHPFHVADIEKYLNEAAASTAAAPQPSSRRSSESSAMTIASADEAIRVLVERHLQSEDDDRSLKAAVAILDYVGNHKTTVAL